MDQRARTGADLPWGWWLRATSRGFEDEQGRTWSSVREAFWCGHLGFPDSNSRSEQIERLVRVLSAIEHRNVEAAGNRDDIFGGDMEFWRFYQTWLASVGLIDAPGTPFARYTVYEAPLSDLGRTVLLMLTATRDVEWANLPFADVIESVRNGERGEAGEKREAALAAFERATAHLPHVFARETMGRVHVITLTGFGTGARMPTRRVMWSQGFGARDSRDDFFAWVAQRVDRWPDWGQFAYHRGADGLTKHLLGLIQHDRVG